MESKLLVGGKEMQKSIPNGFQGTSPYNGSITREQFLFYEMRVTAMLIEAGLNETEITEKIVKENLFQYPTEKSLRRMAKVCLKRLKTLDNAVLISAIAHENVEVAKQICLYAMMKQYRLVWDFMITVIGEKYQLLDLSFGKIDVNTFFMRLQEQDDKVASWSDSTIQKLKQVLIKILVENNYLDNTKATHLNNVMISPVLEKAIKNEGIPEVLPAFNCLS